MPIVVKSPEGLEFHCDTPDEAVAVARGLKISSVSQNATPYIRHRVRSTPQPVPPELIRIFGDSDAKVLDADAMSDVLGTESPNGVGTKLRHMREQYKADGIDLDRYIRTIRQPDGTTKWAIHLTSPIEVS